jgi:hypothetical protein
MSNEFDNIDELLSDPVSSKEDAKRKVAKPLGSKDKRISMDFGQDVSAEDINAAVQMVGKVTKDTADKRNAVSAGRAEYAREGGRRWRCIVESLRPGVKTFAMTVPHPKEDRPVRVEGRCGIEITDGLTKYMINCLNYSHHFRTEEVMNFDPNATMGLTFKPVKVPHYRVEVMEEIMNPVELGKVGAVR